ncbi:MAG TPA: hypothetical protein VFP54_11005 [Acidimicrobiales bacterium]|nr:hypothetical protein [Acidimicrobiales bacterium]
MVGVRLNIATVELAQRQCVDCQTRWWTDQDGRDIDLASVLELAALDRRR